MEADRKGTAYLIAQLLLIGVYLLTPGQRFFENSGYINGMAIGVFFFGMALMTLAALQQYRNLSPFPSPKKESKLTTSGAYRCIRHPIFTGLALSAIALATIKESPIHLALAFILTTLLHFKAKCEEKLLIEMFEDYPGYQSKTGRLLRHLF